MAAVLVGCGLVLWAAPAIGRIRTHNLSFTTGSFVVNCTSSGELCSPPEKLTFRLTHAGRLTSIRYSTPATHCSAVLLHVLRRGHQIAQTHKLAAGEQTERLATNLPLPAGRTTLAFQAQGFLGGCNGGFVGSWGGIVTITVTAG